MAGRQNSKENSSGFTPKSDFLSRMAKGEWPLVELRGPRRSAPTRGSMQRPSQAESTKLFTHASVASASPFLPTFATDKALEARVSPQNTYSPLEYAGHSQGKAEERSCFGKPEKSFSGITETRTLEVQTDLSGDQLMDSTLVTNKLLEMMQVLFGGTSQMRTQETQTNKSSDHQTEPWWKKNDLYERKISAGGAADSRTQVTQTDASSDEPMENDWQDEDHLSVTKIRSNRSTTSRTQGTQTNTFADEPVERNRYTGYPLSRTVARECQNTPQSLRKISAGGATDSRTRATQTGASSDELMETDRQNEDDVSGTKIRSNRPTMSRTQGTQTDTFTDEPVEKNRYTGNPLSGTVARECQNTPQSLRKLLHGESKGNDIPEMVDKKIRDQATQEKIDELSLELKNLMELDHSHTPAFVQLLIDHVKLQRNVILSTKSYPEMTGMSISTENGESEPTPNINVTPGDDREDENQPRELEPKVPTTHNMTLVPSGPTHSSAPSMSWTPSVSRVFPLQTHVVGQAFYSEQQFLNRVEKHLEKWEIYLEKEPFAPTSNRLLLLFCPVMSRAGTDIRHALEKIPAQVRVILVVMNHVPIENSTVYLDSRSQVQHSAVIHTVDCRFSQRSGLYSTEINTDSVLSVAQKIKQEATLPSFKN